jgi:hypothetical protein
MNLDDRSGWRLPEKIGEPMLLSTTIATNEADWTLLRDLGFTLFQTDSEHLSTNEVAPGKWDWTTYDAMLDAVRRNGGNWLFFPHFAYPPPWYCSSPDFVRIACLEHHQTVDQWSIWAPGVDAFYERGYRALAEHYGTSSEGIYAFFLGIHGDYGEACFLCACRTNEPSQRPDWLRRFGNDHNHYGYWCDDPYARASFRGYLKQKYSNLEMVNLVYHTHWSAWEAVEFPTTSVNNRHAWLDFIQWYYDSLTDFAERVAGIARRYFPRTLMMVGLGGGDENPQLGQDNTRLPQVCARHNIHVRSTHGGFLPFPRNYARVKRIATASKFYGAPFWTEPPSLISYEGEIARFFEAISCGEVGYWDHIPNPLRAPEAFQRFGSLLTYEKPLVDVALFFPQTQHRLDSGAGGPGFPLHFEEGAAAVRDVMDWDVVDEQLIQDGALASYRMLILFDGKVIEEPALEQILAWVEAGGLLVALDFGPIETVSGEHGYYNRLFGMTGSTRKVTPSIDAAAMPCKVRLPGFKHLAAIKDFRLNGAYLGLLPQVQVVASTSDNAAAIWAMPHGKGFATYFAGNWEERSLYYELLRDVVYNASELDPALTDALPINDEWDGVYTTLLEGNQVLFYNQTITRVTKKCLNQVITLEPTSLVKLKLDQ